MENREPKFTPDQLKEVVKAQIRKIEALDTLPKPPSYNPRQYGFSLTQFEAPLTFLLPVLTGFVTGMVHHHILNGDQLGTLIAMVGGTAIGLALKIKIFKLTDTGKYL